MNHDACAGSVTALDEGEIHARLQADLPSWSLCDGRLRRTLRFGRYSEIVAFVSAVLAIAEDRNHHPALYADKRDVRVYLWTRKLYGITELDLEMAAAIDDVLRAMTR
jgi:4a-hydroxytetrahydrobiopterin dehydratase